MYCMYWRYISERAFLGAQGPIRRELLTRHSQSKMEINAVVHAKSFLIFVVFYLFLRPAFGSRCLDQPPWSVLTTAIGPMSQGLWLDWDAECKQYVQGLMYAVCNQTSVLSNNKQKQCSQNSLYLTTELLQFARVTPCNASFTENLWACLTWDGYSFNMVLNMLLNMALRFGSITALCTLPDIGRRPHHQTCNFFIQLR